MPPLIADFLSQHLVRAMALKLIDNKGGLLMGAFSRRPSEAERLFGLELDC